MYQELSHCPVTNLLGENIFGHLDYNINTARHATMHNRSTSIVIRHNKPMKWLDRKDKAEKSKLLVVARKKANFVRRPQVGSKRLLMIIDRKKSQYQV